MLRSAGPIEWLQSFSTPGLDRLASAISLFGDEIFYILTVSFVYWSVSRPLGVRLGVLLLSSMLFNFLLKDMLQWPRPWQEHPSIREIRPEGGYGFPSGHAQGNTTFWGFLMTRAERLWVKVVGTVLIVLVSLSRLYLGVHYVGDVVAGIALGALAVALWNRFEPRLAHVLAAWHPALQLIGAGVLPLLPLLVYREPDAYKLCGFVLGISTGAFVERRAVSFEVAGPPSRRIAVVVVGWVGLFALLVVTRGVFSPGPAQLVRYALLGAWMMIGTPWIAVRRGWLPSSHAADRFP